MGMNLRTTRRAGALVVSALLLVLLVVTFGSSAQAQVASSAYRAAVLADSPVSYWRLGETSGTTAADERGLAPGTYSGGPTLGRPGALLGDTNTAALFDGSNDQMSVTSSALNLRTSLTLEAWVRPTSLPGSGEDEIIRRSGQYSLDITPQGAFRLQLQRSSANTRTITSSGGLASTGVWRHVVGTFDGSTMRLYVDGIQRATSTYAQPLASSTSPTRLASTGSGSWLRGTLDEVRVAPVLWLDAEGKRIHGVGDVSAGDDRLVRVEIFKPMPSDPAVQRTWLLELLLRYCLTLIIGNGVFKLKPVVRFGSLASFDPLLSGFQREIFERAALNAGARKVHFDGAAA